MISFKFTDDSPDLLKIKESEISAVKIEENTYTDVSEGTFKGTGIVHFSTYNELFEVFNFLDIKFINKHESKTVYETDKSNFHYSEWIVVGVKK